MTWTAARRLALVAGLLLAVSCAAAEDVTGPTETAPAAPTETASSLAPSPTVPVHEIATVVRVIDGDTFDARLADGRAERIRPPQFDAPERGECWHDEATALLEVLIGGRDVRLLPLSDGPDPTGMGDSYAQSRSTAGISARSCSKQGPPAGSTDARTKTPAS